MRAYFLTVLGFVMIATQAVQAQRYERILFPVVVRQHPGAMGTTWSSEVSVFNGGTAPLDLFRSECYYRCSGPCAITMCFPGEQTQPMAYFEGSLDRGELGSTANPASLLYVDREKADTVSASLRLRELSTGAAEFGIEIPVVRERSLFTSTLTLPTVPMPRSAAGRVHLRLYGVESPSGAARLRVRTYVKGAETSDRLVDLLPPVYSGATPRPDEYDESQPSYLLISLPEELANGDSAILVTVEPVTPGLRFWAMASVTANTTQHVTIVSPAPR